MNTPKPTWLAQHRLGLIATLAVVISVLFLMGTSSIDPEASAEAKVTPAQDAEKKVTVSGVDSTQIEYEQGFSGGTAKGIFHPDPIDDDKDLATYSKIIKISIQYPTAAQAAPFAKDCKGKLCAVEINTNGGGTIRIADSAPNVLQLEYANRGKYRYACPPARPCAAYSKKVNVTNIRLDGSTYPCPGNKCSVEVTYLVQ